MHQTHREAKEWQYRKSRYYHLASMFILESLLRLVSVIFPTLHQTTTFIFSLLRSSIQFVMD
jgi:hypothetical protein